MAKIEAKASKTNLTLNDKTLESEATTLHLSVWQLQTVATADPMVITLQLFVAGPTPQSRLRTIK